MTNFTDAQLEIIKTAFVKMMRGNPHLCCHDTSYSKEEDHWGSEIEDLWTEFLGELSP